MNKQAHLYAIKIMSAILLGMLVFVLLAMYAPTILIWLIGAFFTITIFINLYRVLYDIGKTK